MKSGDRPAMKMNARMMAMMRDRSAANPGATLRESCRHMQLVGTERVTVPAGSYTTKHYRNAQDGSEVWIAADVPFALVKSTAEAKESGRGPVSMTLAATGTGAKPSITETPQEMPTAPGAPRGAPRGH